LPTDLAGEEGHPRLRQGELLARAAILLVRWSERRDHAIALLELRKVASLPTMYDRYSAIAPDSSKSAWFPDSIRIITGLVEYCHQRFVALQDHRHRLGVYRLVSIPRLAFFGQPLGTWGQQ
jgi:hypothetical protein